MSGGVQHDQSRLRDQRSRISEAGGPTRSPGKCAATWKPRPGRFGDTRYQDTLLARAQLQLGFDFGSRFPERLRAVPELLERESQSWLGASRDDRRSSHARWARRPSGRGTSRSMQASRPMRGVQWYSTSAISFSGDRVTGTTTTGLRTFSTSRGQASSSLLGPSLSWDKSEAQFLGRVTDPAATNTYGSRYIFASVDQTTLSLDTRVNYTFSPSLSLQVFAQPFIASGAFGPTKEFAKPNEFDFLTYGKDVGADRERPHLSKWNRRRCGFIRCASA